MKRTLSILVVDDDRGVLGTVVEVIETAGHSCFRASTPTEALEIAALHELQATVLDMHLGGSVTGLEILGRLRGIHRRLAAILMSGDLTAEIRMEAGKVGVKSVLGKPIDLAALRDAVDRLAV